MSLLKFASTTPFALRSAVACAIEPISPCSSPAHVTNTSVASNSIPLSANTRASSIVSDVPLPSSFAPGASALSLIVGRTNGAFGAPGAAPAAVAVASAPAGRREFTVS